LIVSFFQSLAF